MSLLTQRWLAILPKYCQQVKTDDPSHYLALARPHLEFCIHYWIPPCKRHGTTGETPVKDHDNEGTGASYKKRLIKLELLSLQNAQGNLKVYKYLKEECKECSQALFSGAQNFKTWIIKGSVIML